MKNIGAVLIIIGMFAFSNCKARKPQRVIAVTFSGEKQKTIKVHKGNTLLIKLPMASGTGFVWQVSGKPRFCIQEDTKYEHIKRNMPGAPLTEIMRFSITASGAEDIVFIYHRPLANNSVPANKKKLHLIVE
ncbi:MAG: protease inhibitor I42 family protein [Ginsengibacter sp.]